MLIAIVTLVRVRIARGTSICVPRRGRLVRVVQVQGIQSLHSHLCVQRGRRNAHIYHLEVFGIAGILADWRVR